jgi:uncharacterized membrane protein YeiH
MTLIALLDYLGVALFAATGALAASRRELDLIGFMFLASVTGIGEGTVRDLILDVPVFWVAQPVHILICAGTATLVYFTAHLVEYRYRLLLWLDAVALAAYAVFGASKGLAVTGSPVLAVVMGVLTGTLGGILRDVLANEPSVLLRKEIYVTAAMAGALGYVVASTLGLPPPVPSAMGFTLALAIRSAALAFGWTLPTYRSRPGRDIS